MEDDFIDVMDDIIREMVVKLTEEYLKRHSNETAQT